MSLNDNDFPIPGAAHPASDSHGQAALLLVESLIHALCENATLTTREAVVVAERAVEVQFDRAEAADGAGMGAGAPLWRSHALLSAIAASLRTDGGGASMQQRPVL